MIDVRSLARAHTEACIKKLAGFATADEGVPQAVQVQAAQILLDRGWGKPAQVHTGDENEPIIVEIIQRVRENKA